MQPRLLLLFALVLLTALSVTEAKEERITSKGFERLMQLLADSWNKGDARKAADCFAENVIYSEPPDKQLYKGRAELFRFFGGNEGRKSAMKMTWHHLVFNEQKQVGAGEFTFEYGSKVHGIAMIKSPRAKLAIGENIGMNPTWIGNNSSAKTNFDHPSGVTPAMLLAKLVDLLSMSCTMTCQLKSLW